MGESEGLLPSETPLPGYLVVDLSSGVAGAYCGKVLADGGAEVVKVEPPEGDPLRRRTVTGGPAVGDDDGALYQYLACSTKSVVCDPDRADDVELVRRLVAVADAVIWSPESRLAQHEALQPEALRALAPSAAVVAITPFGLEGPWAGRPATPATLEAWGGGAGQRGSPLGPPMLAGGELPSWVAGMFAGAGVLMSLYRRDTGDGGGELIDVSVLESAAITQVMYPVTWYSVAGYPWRAGRALNIPDIHPTRDGHVGFMVITGQQWLDFCTLVERPDWAEDDSLFYYHARNERREELLGAINDWASKRTTAEATEQASLYRIPTAPVGNGALTPYFDHFTARDFYVKNPRGGFLQPDVPYVLSNGAARRPFEPAPRLGEHTDEFRSRVESGGSVRAPQATPTSSHGSPVADLRIADFTVMWAGPIISHLFAMMGADVIHVESIQRPDGMRYSQVRKPGEPDWWEWGPLYQGANTNKRGLTLDVTAESGNALARRLLEHCDIVIDNFSPRVMEGFGLTYEAIARLRPEAIVLRAPAFGLTGPWRDWVGYAQTMEQATGMAYITGDPAHEPQVPNGPCDPIAGIHAQIALLLALHYRRRTGKGMLVEVAMVRGALNIAAEQVIEHSAYGNLVERIGNRSHLCAPQGMYRSADVDDSGRQDRWVMISVDTDIAWTALCAAIERPDLAADPTLRMVSGRQRAHDRLDQAVAEWCTTRPASEIVDRLWSAGVPVAVAVLPHEQLDNEQLVARRYFETVEHPLCGSTTHTAYPVRFSTGPERFHHRPAPMLGEHNEEILGGLLGLSAAEIEQLEHDGVIGNAPPQQRGWGV